MKFRKYSQKISRRGFIQATGAGAATLVVQGKVLGALPAQDRSFEHGQPLHEFQYGQIQFQAGLQQTQLEETHSVLMSLNEDSLLRPFRIRAGLPAPGSALEGRYYEDANFLSMPGSTFGQWVSALSRYYAITGNGETRAKVDRLVSGFSETIEPAGKLYDRQRHAYIYDKLVCGLMDAHQFANNGMALDVLANATEVAAARLPGKALSSPATVEEYNACNSDEHCFDSNESYTLPENQFIAWQRGGNSRHLELAKQYLADDFFFNPLARGENVLPGKHAYSHVNALCSAAKAYLVLGDEKYLRAAQNGFAFVDAQSFVTGGWGPNETFVQPGSGKLGESLATTHDHFETPCGSYAHFKLTRYLLRITKDPLYGDSMERVMYNTVLGAKSLQQDGRDFYYSDYHTPGRKSYLTDKYSHGNWLCCSGTLPQVAADYRISTYFHDPEGVFVNLYIPSTVRWRQKGAQISLTQSGQYPVSDAVTLSVTTSQPAKFAIRLRIPAWSQAPSICINGQKTADSVQPGTFFVLRRKWRSGDRIELELPRKLELKSVDTEHPDTVALVYGPLVLFAITEDVPIATRAQLLAAKRQSPESIEWYADAGPIPELLVPVRFLPFWAIKDERYTTYLSVT